MNNRLISGAAVEMSSAVGLKNNRYKVFVMGIRQYIKAWMCGRKVAINVYSALCQAREKMSTID